jgi:hypothetical protein
LRIHIGEQFLVLGSGQPLLEIHQIILKACNRISLFPVFKSGLGTYSAASEWHGLSCASFSFDQGGAFAAAGVRRLRGLSRKPAGVGAVNDHARIPYAIARSARSSTRNCMQREWSIPIDVLDEQDQPEILRRQFKPS